jgi:threonine dehydratase
MLDGKIEVRIPKLRGVYAARNIVKHYLKPTPLIHSKPLSKLLGCKVFLKLENLQPTRAFKVRGGVYFMEKRAEEAKSRGVIAASTGNHAQSVAYAASLFGVDAKIVMPQGVPSLKIEAVCGLGAEVIIKGEHYDQAREYAEKLATASNSLYVHASNEPLLFEGVGTMHLEIIEEQPDIDIVINPIGGGSGAASACMVYKTLDPHIKVIGVQAEGAPAFFNSWKSGTITSTDGVRTTAEGLATSQAYELPLKMLRGQLDNVILVSDEEMRQAVRTIFSTTGQVAELAGAASTAAAIKIKGELRGKSLALLVTGGNIEPTHLAQILGS